MGDVNVGLSKVCEPKVEDLHVSVHVNKTEDRVKGIHRLSRTNKNCGLQIITAKQK